MTSTEERLSETIGSRADGKEEWSVEYWTHRLGCTVNQLRTAVEVVGVLPKLAPLRRKLLGCRTAHEERR